MKFRPIIGLEIHAQLATKTKMFCGCDNKAWGAEPNTLTCPVCLGMPGQLPVINSESVRLGVRAGLALGCKIPARSRFDRKSYFYPDSPKGYQITQFAEPVAVKGLVEYFDGEEKKSATLDRLHLEDDAGKLTHVSDGSLVDWNRSGTPLAEIVSDPCLHSPSEARAYAQAVRSLVVGCGAGHANLERGEMRFDVNVSVEVTKDDGEVLITPITEVKNLNSFSLIEEVAEFEIKRKTKLFLEDGLTLNDVGKTTMGWNPDKGSTYVLREKEDAADYRYFPEPDLPPIELEPEYIETERALLPESPIARCDRYVSDLGLKFDDAVILTKDPNVSTYFEEVVESCGDSKKASNWIISSLFGKLSEASGRATAIEDSPITASMLGEMIKLIVSGDISGKIGKDVFEILWTDGGSANAIVEEKGWKQVSDTGAIESVCKEVLDENPDSVASFLGGKDKALGALIGQVMKKTGGQANPAMVNETMKKLVEEGKS